MGTKKLVVTLEIVCGDCEDKDYVGIMDTILEESGHWGDFDANVVQQTIVDEKTGETYPLGFFDREQ